MFLTTNKKRLSDHGFLMNRGRLMYKIASHVIIDDHPGNEAREQSKFAREMNTPSTSSNNNSEIPPQPCISSPRSKIQCIFPSKESMSPSLASSPLSSISQHIIDQTTNSPRRSPRLLLKKQLEAGYHIANNTISPGLAHFGGKVSGMTMTKHCYYI